MNYPPDGIRPYRTPLTLALALLALGAPAGAFEGLPVAAAAVLSFAAIFIAPGLILTLTVFDESGWRWTDSLEYVACSYSFSLGVLAVPALALLAFNLGWRTFDYLFTAVILLLLIAYVWRSPRRPQTFAKSEAQSDGGKSWPLFVLLIVAAVAIVPLARESTLDGDTFTYLAYIQEMQDTANMNQVEALFGTDIEVAPRSRFNIWTTLPAYLVHTSGTDAVTMSASYLPPMLALVALAAFHTLALALTRRTDFALLATLIQVLLILTAPFHRETNISSMVLQRIVADKFMVLLLVLPVQTAFSVRWLIDGRRRDLSLTILITLASSFVHPLLAAFFAIVIVSFGGIHVLANVRKRSTWIRVGLAVLVALLGLALPLLLRQQTTSSRGAYLFPADFEGWPLVLRPTPILPFTHILSLSLRDPGPAILDVQPEDAAAEGGLSPFLLWRFRTNMRARRLLLFSPGQYISHPDLIIEIPILLMLFLIPMLLVRLQRPLIQYVVGVTLAVLMLLYNPLLTPQVGNLITPWMIWRLTWLFPVSLVLAYAAYSLLLVAQRRLERAWPRLRWVPTLVPAAVLIGLASLGRNHIETRAHELQRHIGQPAGDDVAIVEELDRELNGAQATVLAKLDISVLIPAYISRADVVGHRVNTTSEHFPEDRQVDAMRRVMALERFYATDLLLSDSLAILERYGVDYVIADRRSGLAAQLRNLEPHVTPVSRTREHVLFHVHNRPPANEIFAGNDALAAQQWEVAQRLFEQAIERHPRDVLAWAGLGRAFEGSGSPERAADAYQRAVELVPADPWFYTRLARSYESSAEVELAITEYEKARALDPEDVDLALTLADLYRTQGDTARAESTYAGALKRLPEGNVLGLPKGNTRTAAYYGHVGDLWFERQLFDRAAEAFARAAALDPRESRLVRESQAHQAAGQFDQALRTAQHAVALYPRSPTSYRQLGTAYNARGETASAISAYERSIWLADFFRDPQVDPYVELGNIYAELGEFEQAEAQFRAALSLDPYAAAPYIGLGALFETLGHREDAVTAYSRAVEVEPSSILSYVNLGRLYLEQQQTDAALAQYEAAVETRPTEYIAHVLLGEAYRQAGRLNQAAQTFRRAITLHPTNTLAHIGLTHTYVALARLRDARGQAQTAVRMAPGSARAHIALADVYRLLAEPQNAMAEYQAAMEAEPDFAGSHLALGQAHEARGDLTAALIEYQRAVELERDSAQLQLALGDANAAMASRARSTSAHSATSVGLDSGAVDGSRDVLSGSKGLQGSQATADAQMFAAQAAEAYRRAMESDPQYVPPYGALVHLQIALGQPDAAIATATEAVDRNPRLARAHLVLGETLLGRGRVDDALAAYARAQELAPSDIAVVVALGRARQFLGQVPEAIAQFRAAVDLNPYTTTGYLALGDAQLLFGEPQAALETFETAADIEPGSTAAHLGRSRALLALGQTDRALEAAAEGIRVRPGEIDGYLAQGTVLERMGLLEEAQAQYERATTLSPGSPAPHLALGDMWLAQGDPDKALKAYRTAIAAAPGDLSGWLALADTLAATDEVDNAIATYQFAADLNQGQPDGWISLGELYADFGRTGEAEAAFQQALDQAPGEPRALLGLASLYEEQGELKLAFEQARSAVAARPGSVQAHVVLGDLFQKRGDVQAAVQAYREALRIAPGDRSASLALGRLYMARADWTAAAATLERAIAANPREAGPYLALAALQSRRGAIDSARETLERATAVSRYGQATVDTLVAQGDLEASLGYVEEAAAAYERAYQLDPTDIGAHTGLATTYAELGRHNEAGRLARELLNRRPASAASHLVLGRVLHARGDLVAATRAYQKAIALSDQPDAALDARLRLAQIATAQSDFTWTEELLRAAVANAPGAPAGHVALGRFLQSRDRTSEAADTFMQAVRLDRSQAVPWIALGDLRSDQGDEAGAWSAYEMAKRTEPADPIPHLRLSHLYRNQGDLQQALVELRAAARKQPGSAVVQLAMGDVYRELGEPGPAIQAYGEVTTLGSDERQLAAWFGLGRIYLSQERYDLAIDAFERTVVDEPNDISTVAAYLGIAQSYEATDDTSSAVKWYTSAVELKPSIVEAQLTLGDLLADQERFAEAEVAYKQAVATDTTAYQAHLALAEIYLAREDTASAQQALEQALITSGGRAGHVGLLRIYHQQGEEEDAIERFEEVAKRQLPGPDTAWVQMILAGLHDALEEIDDAIAAYERVVELDPGNVAAHQRLAELNEGRDNARAIAAWKKVIDLAPDTEAADEARDHLDDLRS